MRIEVWIAVVIERPRMKRTWLNDTPRSANSSSSLRSARADRLGARGAADQLEEHGRRYHADRGAARTGRSRRARASRKSGRARSRSEPRRARRARSREIRRGAARERRPEPSLEIEIRHDRDVPLVRDGEKPVTVSDVAEREAQADRAEDRGDRGARHPTGFDPRRDVVLRPAEHRAGLEGAAGKPEADEAFVDAAVRAEAAPPPPARRSSPSSSRSRARGRPRPEGGSRPCRIRSAGRPPRSGGFRRRRPGLRRSRRARGAARASSRTRDRDEELRGKLAVCRQTPRTSAGGASAGPPGP